MTHTDLQSIDIARIRPSPLNPRKHFDPAKLQELAESIKSKGILEPVLVRPVASEHKTKLGGKNMVEVRMDYELVAGERRYRAAKLAGCKDIPARVLELSDKDALEVMVVENEQRADTSPLEKAAGYAALIEEHQVPIDELAQRVGKSVSTIRGLLLLPRLPEKARLALEKEEIPLSTAQVIAHVPGQFLRERVALCVLAGQTWHNPESFRNPSVEVPSRHFGMNDGPLSYRDAKELVQQNCMVELKQARFPRKQRDLVAGVPDCDSCPKRAGNDPDLKADGIRADVCTDPECFRQKTAAWTELVASQAKEQGQEVLDAKEAANLFDQWNCRLKHGAAYVDLADQCDEDKAKKRPRSYKQLLGAAADDHLVIAIDARGQAHRLVPQAAAAVILWREHKIKLPAPSANGHGSRRGPQSDEDKREQVKRRAENHLRAAVLHHMLDSASIAVAEAFSAMRRDEVLPNQVLRLLIYRRAEQCWGNNLEIICRRRGLPGQRKPELLLALQDALAMLGGPELVGLLVEFDAIQEFDGFRADKNGYAKILQLDKRQIEKEVRAKLKEGVQAKETKPSANGHASNGKSKKEAKKPVTRDTFLVDLLQGNDVRKPGRALEEAKLHTVGDLLDRAATFTPGARHTDVPDSQRPYTALRRVKGLDANSVNEIGDALIDAGLFLPQRKPEPNGQAQASSAEPVRCASCGSEGRVADVSIADADEDMIAWAQWPAAVKALPDWESLSEDDAAHMCRHCLDAQEDLAGEDVHDEPESFKKAKPARR